MTNQPIELPDLKPRALPVGLPPIFSDPRAAGLDAAWVKKLLAWKGPRPTTPDGWLFLYLGLRAAMNEKSPNEQKLLDKIEANASAELMNNVKNAAINEALGLDEDSRIRRRYEADRQTALSLIRANRQLNDWMLQLGILAEPVKAPEPAEPEPTPQDWQEWGAFLNVKAVSSCYIPFGVADYVLFKTRYHYIAVIGMFDPKGDLKEAAIRSVANSSKQFRPDDLLDSPIYSAFAKVTARLLYISKAL